MNYQPKQKIELYIEVLQWLSNLETTSTEDGTGFHF